MRKFLMLTAAALWCAPALGADLPVKRPILTKAPVAAPGYNWSGIYIDGHFDYGANLTHTLTSLAGGTTSIDLATIPNGAGVGGGVELLYQGLGSEWVIGIVGDIGYMNLSSTGNFTAGGVNLLSVSNATNYLGSIDAKVGYTIDPRLLVYAVGGLGFGGAHPNLAAAGLCAAGTSCTQAINDTSTGWHVGAGLDYAIPLLPIDVFIQGEYFDLGSRSLSVGTPAIVTSSAQYKILRQEAGLRFKLQGPN